MKEFIKNYGKYLVYLLVGLCLFFGIYKLGCYVDKEWQEFKNRPASGTTVVQPTIIQGQGTIQKETTVQYVDKPVLVYTDPTTGKTVEKVDPTDARITADPAKVNVLVNGKPYSFDLKQGETQKFQKGQLVLDQSSTVDFKLDIQPTIIDNTSSGGIDVYAGNKDKGIGIRHKRLGVDIGKTYKGDLETRARYELVKFK